MQPRILPALVGLAVAAWPASAGTLPEVRIIELGAYTVQTESIVAEPGQAGSGISPLALVTDPRFTEHTDRIEARLCRRFGIRYAVLHADSGVHLTLRIAHPMITAPDGRQADVESWESTNDGEPGLAGFNFAHSYELVPGAWTFSVLYEGQVLAEHRFDVVPAQADAPPLDGCGAKVS